MFTSSLISILGELNSALPDIEAVGVVHGSGYLAASTFPEGLDEERVSALCSAILAWGGKTAQQLSKGEVEQVLLQGQSGYAVICRAGNNAALVVMTPSGDGLEEIKRAADSIAALLQ